MAAARPELRRKRTALWVLVAAFALGGLPRSGSAQIVTVPGDLSPGAGYRLIFVTSAGRNGASANVADYNAFVTARANAVAALAALGTTWTAVAETATVTAQNNTGTNPLIVGGIPTNPGVPFYRLDGARVANDNAYFWSMLFPLANISITELGTSAPISVRSPDGSTQTWVWTGFTTGPSKLGSSFPVAGWATGGGAGSWLGIAIASNSNSFPLYAVSGILQVPVQQVPLLPPAGVVALLALLAALGARYARIASSTSRSRSLPK